MTGPERSPEITQEILDDWAECLGRGLVDTKDTVRESSEIISRGLLESKETIRESTEMVRRGLLESVAILRRISAKLEQAERELLLERSGNEEGNSIVGEQDAPPNP